MESMQKVLRSLDTIIANTESALSAASGEAMKADAAKTNATPLPRSGGGGKKADPKKKKGGKTAPTAALPPEAAQFLQCDLRVGEIVSAKHHPDAEGLFAMTIAHGELGERSVCAGLRGFFTEEELHGRLVVTICNLKPRILRGVPSEAMILAGSVRTDGKKEAVQPLSPPEGSTPGDFVYVQGMDGERTVVDGKFVSGKTWDKIVSRLTVIGGKACYDGNALVVGGKPVTCPMPDGVGIH